MISRFFVIAVLLWLVAACAFAENSHDRTQFGHDIVVGAGEEVSQATCFGCSVRVRGRVAGDVTTFGGGVVGSMQDLLSSSFSSLKQPDMDNTALVHMGISEALLFVKMVLPFAGLFMVTGIAVNILQVGFHVTPKALRPQPSRLNPLTGAILWHNPMNGYGMGTPTSLVSKRGSTSQTFVVQAAADEKKKAD